MKVLLIEPMEHPKEIDIQPTLEEYYKVLDCDCITAASQTCRRNSWTSSRNGSGIRNFSFAPHRDSQPSKPATAHSPNKENGPFCLGRRGWLVGWWGPRIIENPFPVYCILALVCKNSKPGKSRIFHDL